MKTKVLLAVAVLAGLATSAQAASIVGSKHDLSSTNGKPNSIYATNQNQTCVFCHAPHNALTNKLLWNRTTTGMPGTMAIYTSYNTGAMRSALSQSTLGTDSSSLLCLSCHSLSTAAQIIANVQSSTVLVSNGENTSFPSRTGNMNNLTNDHPVGINYDAAFGVAGATGLVASASTVAGQTVGGLVSAGGLRLFKSNVSGTSTMECGTCHSVHDPANGKFLAKSNSQSALCVTCHVK
jgi:predicted CXXCH cytochrome family protein